MSNAANEPERQALERRAELRWDDPTLQVRSDTRLRAQHRALQSWYREHRLNARFAPSGPGGRTEPVGSLLHSRDVTADRALNFFGDAEILAFVTARARQVKKERGSAEPDRLFHNMLSSMPMAFSLAAVLSSAPDAPALLSSLFGVRCDEMRYVTAEWAPVEPARRIGRTAFDIAARYRTPGGTTELLGIETKYTESPSDTIYITDEWVELTERCGWFRPGAADRIADGETNQMWRNVLLAVRQEASGSCGIARVAAVGLAEDDAFASAVHAVQSELLDDHRDRLVLTDWNQVTHGLHDTTLESFAYLFRERYLDTWQIDAPDAVVLRRSIRADETQRIRAFAAAKQVPRPDDDTMGDSADWGRWLPSIWRALGDDSAVVTVPTRPTALINEPHSWWTPLLHLLLYRLAWPSPTVGLDRWNCDGRPLEDRGLALIEALWGRHLELMADQLRHGACSQIDIGHELDLPSTPPPHSNFDPDTGHNDSNPAWSPAPYWGGYDPLHLSRHCFAPVEKYDPGSATLHIGDLGIAGPPRAMLICDKMQGWYRALHDLGSTLPNNSAGQGWRVDVVIRPIGHIGLYRWSRVTKRWFAGQHRWHLLGHPG